jgi:hypothetical protein
MRKEIFKEIHLYGNNFRFLPLEAYYKGFKVSIMRIDDSDYSDINHRYLVTKEFLNSELKNPY